MEKPSGKAAVIATIKKEAIQRGGGCFAVSLAEAAIAIGTRESVNLVELDERMGVDQKGNTPTGQFFAHLRRGADALGIEVPDVAVTPKSAIILRTAP